MASANRVSNTPQGSAVTRVLEGKIALVTGGARGIGAAIVRRLAADGARVAFTYATSAEPARALVAEIGAAGGAALAISADSADASAVVAAVDAAAKAFGGLDILVNNAGVGVAASVADTRIEDYDHTFAVNVRAVFVAMQAGVRHMRPGGRIITIGSVNADRIPFAGGAIYAATKAAVAGLSRGAARDFGPLGITVNVVQPGPIDTDMNPANGPWASAAKAMLASGAYGEGADVAALVAFVAGPEAGFITGACLNVDGGYLA